MIRHLATAVLAATSLVLLPAAVSAAPPKYLATPVPLAAKPAAAPPFASLTLTVTADEVTRHAAAPVTLTCGPAGGTHPSPATACAALAKTNGAVFRLPPRQGVLCTADYRPVTASVTGYWGKRKIADKRTFGNACQLGIAAGAVFAAK